MHEEAAKENGDGEGDGGGYTPSLVGNAGGVKEHERRRALDERPNLLSLSGMVGFLEEKCFTLRCILYPCTFNSVHGASCCTVLHLCTLITHDLWFYVHLFASHVISMHITSPIQPNSARPWRWSGFSDSYSIC